jgi:hypothetical protein
MTSYNEDRRVSIAEQHERNRKMFAEIFEREWRHLYAGVKFDQSSPDEDIHGNIDGRFIPIIKDVSTGVATEDGWSFRKGGILIRDYPGKQKGELYNLRNGKFKAQIIIKAFREKETDETAGAYYIVDARRVGEFLKATDEKGWVELNGQLIKRSKKNKDGRNWYVRVNHQELHQWGALLNWWSKPQICINDLTAVKL